MVVLFAIQDLRRAIFFPGNFRFPKGAPTKPDLGNPSENASFCDRSRSTPAAVEREWCLRAPRAARGLTDAYHPSKRGRCGDASGLQGVCRPKGRIFERISSVVVLFAIQDLRRAIFPRENSDFQGEPRPNPTREIRARMLHFQIGRGRRQRLRSETGASATLAPLVV